MAFEESASPPSAPPRRPRRTSAALLIAVIVTVAGVCSWWIDSRTRTSWLVTNYHLPTDSFVGRVAPDFVLADVQTGEPVRLAESFGRRPVFLMFGSFSCPRLVNELPAIRRLSEEYKEKADFRLVYSKEAYHRNPEFEEFCRQNPGAEEQDRVRAGLEFYDLDFPCVVADAAVERGYVPFPARVLVFDRTGAVVFDSRPALAEAGLRFPEAAERLRECVGAP